MKTRIIAAAATIAALSGVVIPVAAASAATKSPAHAAVVTRADRSSSRDSVKVDRSREARGLDR